MLRQAQHDKDNHLGHPELVEGYCSSNNLKR